MADNVPVTPGSGADIATDDIGGVQYQRVKVTWGADGVANDASADNPLPVVQTGTPALPTGAATEATLAAVQAAVEGTLAVDGSGVTQPVSAVSLPLPTGAATEATLDAIGMLLAGTLTVTGTVTANLGTANVTNAGTFAVQVDGAALTALQSLAGAVGGTELQVDIVGALPAGTNTIGKLAANSGVDIGDVDILSVVPGTGATNLGKAEDAAHSSGDTGVMALGVRQDAPTALAANGDYLPPIMDSRGRLHVTHVEEEYETVAAGQTDQVLGGSGAAGDFLDYLLIVPATAAAGAVSIKDGGGSSISLFPGGAVTALPSLVPFVVPWGARSVSGAWSVTTGTNVSVVAFGDFT